MPKHASPFLKLLSCDSISCLSAKCKVRLFRFSYKKSGIF